MCEQSCDRALLTNAVAYQIICSNFGEDSNLKIRLLVLFYKGNTFSVASCVHGDNIEMVKFDSRSIIPCIFESLESFYLAYVCVSMYVYVYVCMYVSLLRFKVENWRFQSRRGLKGLE